MQNNDENLLNYSSIVSQKEVPQSISKTNLKNKIGEQNQSTKDTESIAVFKNFSDFLTHPAIHRNQQQLLTNLLVINSLPFFDRSLLLIDKRERIHLYFDHNEADKTCFDIALRCSTK